MTASTTFVLCLRNDGYQASLEPRKVYRALPDSEARVHGQLRVVDESGEDYLFPKSFFVEIKLPAAIRRAVFSGRRLTKR
jgi:hypothetical protein